MIRDFSQLRSKQMFDALRIHGAAAQNGGGDAKPAGLIRIGAWSEHALALVAGLDGDTHGIRCARAEIARREALAS